MHASLSSNDTTTEFDPSENSEVWRECLSGIWWEGFVLPDS